MWKEIFVVWLGCYSSMCQQGPRKATKRIDPAEIQTGNLSNTILYRYRCTSMLGREYRLWSYIFYDSLHFPGAWRWPSTPSSAEVKEKVELYLYSPSGPSRLVVGWTLLLYHELSVWLCYRHISGTHILSVAVLPILYFTVFVVVVVVLHVLYQHKVFTAGAGRPCL